MTRLIEIHTKVDHCWRTPRWLVGSIAALAASALCVPTAHAQQCLSIPNPECNVPATSGCVDPAGNTTPFLSTNRTRVVESWASANQPYSVHHYSIWLDPRGADGADLPLTTTDRARYCATAQEMARRVWEMTGGIHKIERVNFNYTKFTPILDSGQAAYELVWYRYHGTANAGNPLQMFDANVTCASAQSVRIENGDLVAQVSCPPGFHCAIGSNIASRGECTTDGTDTGGTTLETVEELGWTLGHELGHKQYGVPDEYASFPGTLFAEDGVTAVASSVFLLLDESIATNTSIMGSRRTTRWCDSATHQKGRCLDGQFYQNLDCSDFNAWSVAQAHWPDLCTGYFVGDNLKQLPPLDLPPEQEFCVFEGDLIGGQPLNDVLLSVDRSGSMTYRRTESSVTAYDGAINAALAAYNFTEAGHKAGIQAFNQATTSLVPYGTRTGVVARGDITVGATGSTDICEAIRTGAQEIRMSAPEEAQGYLVLLTDGRPTTIDCSTDQAVLDAVAEVGNAATGVPISVSTIGFGDANFSLLQQIAAISGGASRYMSNLLPPDDMDPVPPGVPPGTSANQVDPIDIQAAMTRVAYMHRGFREAMYTHAPALQTRNETFDVPPGTEQLDAVWVGDSFSRTIALDLGASLDCNFASQVTTLIDPNGNAVGGPSVPAQTEEGYFTRTKRVMNPTAGRWTMRTTTNSRCLTLDHVLRVTNLAVIRNVGIHPEMEVSRTSAGVNSPVEVVASLRVGGHTLLTNISATLDLIDIKNGHSVRFTMVDNGILGDEVAGDGRYTALINRNCLALDPGGYRLAVNLQSTVNSSPVRAPGHEHVIAALEPPLAGAVAASFSLERSLHVQGCIDAEARAACGQPPPPAGSECAEVEVQPPSSCLLLQPGASVQDVTVKTQGGFPVADAALRLGIGAGIRASNIRSSYDGASGEGTITFDVTTDANVKPGAYGINVHMNGLVARTRLDTPIFTTQPETIVISSCEPSPQDVTLSPPSSVQNCGVGVAQGQVVAINGKVLAVPIPITGAPIKLPVGSHRVLWEIPTAGGTQTFEQVVEVVHQVSAACCGAGQTLIQGTAAANTIVPTAEQAYCVLAEDGADYVLTRSLGDLIFGAAGADYLNAAGGNDVVVGGTDADFITGGVGGAFRAFGGPGDDSMSASQSLSVVFYGGLGRDSLVGGPGADWIAPGPGADFVSGGEGNDTVVLYHECEAVHGLFVDGGVGSDTLVTPLTLSQLSAAGVQVVNFENIVINQAQRHLSECF